MTKATATIPASVHVIIDQIVRHRNNLPATLDPADLRQELLLYAFEHADELADMPPAHVRRSLSNEVWRMTQKEKNRYLDTAAVRARNATAWYTRTRVEAILEFMFRETEDLFRPNLLDPDRPEQDMPHMIAMLTDVRSAYYTLSPDQRTDIAARHRDGLSFHDLARRDGQAESSPRRRYNRAMNRLISILGGEPSAFVPQTRDRNPAWVGDLNNTDGEDNNK